MFDQILRTGSLCGGKVESVKCCLDNGTTNTPHTHSDTHTHALFTQPVRVFFSVCGFSVCSVTQIVQQSQRANAQEEVHSNSDCCHQETRQTYTKRSFSGRKLLSVRLSPPSSSLSPMLWMTRTPLATGLRCLV